MSYIYWALSFLYQPFAWLHLAYRKVYGKELAVRYREKIGIYSLKRPTGKLIWFHVASMGELNSILPLIEKLAGQNKKIRFLVTTVTVTAARVFERANLPRTIHQFAPLDGPTFVKRFFAHWKPSLGIFIDSELWPNLLGSSARHCKLVMVNGRLSDKSYRRWLNFKGYAKQLYDNFSFILASSHDDFRKISTFADGKRVMFIGHLKYTTPIYTSRNDKEIKLFRDAIGKRPFWVAACTHAGEYNKLLEVHKKLQVQHPGLLMVLAPRHIALGPDIAKEAIKLRLSVELRSTTTKVSSTTDVYVIDALIKLSMLYEIADIVFLGGSLIPRGGHNILEPARGNCAIIIGPHTSNFKDIVADFKEANAILVVKNPTELEHVIEQLLSDPRQVKRLAVAAQKVAGKGKLILANTVKLLEPYIDA